jgi:hypothetical protein
MNKTRHIQLNPGKTLSKKQSEIKETLSSAATCDPRMGSETHYLVLRSDLRPWDGLPLDYHHLVLPPTL